MYTVYILKNLSNNRCYVGYTDNVRKRLLAHNNGKVRSTKAHRPWKIVYQEEFADKTSARKRELQIKSYKGGEAFKKLIS